MIPRYKQFTVIGIFKVDMFEYDASLAMIHLQDARCCRGWAIPSAACA
jgi:lipoprotein-releasing system permease protein